MRLTPLLLLTLLAAGCSGTPTASVGGPYQGFLGDEEGMKKIGLDGTLSQKDGVVTGNCTVNIASEREQFSGPAQITGEVSGDVVKLKFAGAPEKFLISVEAKWSAEGAGNLRGEALLNEGPPVLSKWWGFVRSAKVHEPGKVPFLWKVQSTRS